MSTTPLNISIAYRILVNGDPAWGQGQSNFLIDIDAVAQAILTRLRLFQGEWWAATNDGLPLWQGILGQSAGDAAQQRAASLITARILGTPFVTGVANVQINFVIPTRAFSYAALVYTKFGTLTVTNIPTPPSGAL